MSILGIKAKSGKDLALEGWEQVEAVYVAISVLGVDPQVRGNFWGTPWKRVWVKPPEDGRILVHHNDQVWDLPYGQVVVVRGGQA